MPESSDDQSRSLDSARPLSASTVQGLKVNFDARSSSCLLLLSSHHSLFFLLSLLRLNGCTKVSPILTYSFNSRPKSRENAARKKR